MQIFQRCIALIFVVLKKIKAVTAEGPISELSFNDFYFKMQDDVGELYFETEDKDEILNSALGDLSESLGDITMKMGWERDGISLEGTGLDRSEVEIFNDAVEHAKKALERYRELDMQEPQRLVQIFRELVNRRNELDPAQAQDRPR